jgi:hypothetical protein
VLEIGDLTIALEQKSRELQACEITSWQLQEKLQHVWLTLEQKSKPNDYPKLPANTNDKQEARFARLDDRVERAAQLAQSSRDLEFIME